MSRRKSSWKPPPHPPGSLGPAGGLGGSENEVAKSPRQFCCERRVPVWVPTSSIMPPRPPPPPPPTVAQQPQTVTADVSCWALPSNTPRPTDRLSSEVQEKDSRGDFPGLDPTPFMPSLPPLLPGPSSTLSMRTPKEKVPAEEGGMQEPRAVRPGRDSFSKVTGAEASAAKPGFACGSG